MTAFVLQHPWVLLGGTASLLVGFLTLGLVLDRAERRETGREVLTGGTIGIQLERSARTVSSAHLYRAVVASGHVDGRPRLRLISGGRR